MGCHHLHKPAIKFFAENICTCDQRLKFRDAFVVFERRADSWKRLGLVNAL